MLEPLSHAGALLAALPYLVKDGGENMKVADRGPIWGCGLSETLQCSVGRPRGPDLSLWADSPLGLKTLWGLPLWPNRNTH